MYYIRTGMLGVFLCIASVRGCKECSCVLHSYGDVRSVPVYYIRTGMLGVFQ